MIVVDEQLTDTLERSRRFGTHAYWIWFAECRAGLVADQDGHP